MTGVGASDTLARFRAARDGLESAVLPLATSLDGRAFEAQLPLDGLAVHVGGFVVIGDGARARLGQVHALRLERRPVGHVDVAMAEAGAGLQAGLVLRCVAADGVVLSGDGEPFHDAPIRAGGAGEVERLLAGLPTARGARLAVGELARAPGVPALLDARGFGRHTFLCGQSGSGKTYALGVLLERLLTETSLRILVLDPNSDYVRLDGLAPGVAEDGDDARRYAAAAAGIAVHRANAADGAVERLRLRLAELAPETRAALLRLDPIADREEHAELADLLARGGPPSLDPLERSDRPAARDLVVRARSLGLDRLGIWAREEPGSVLDALARPDVRCLVVDLGSLPTRVEQDLVAASVLGRLWSAREAREPWLVVIDEAHAVCPAQPTSALAALATEEVVRLAGEGRKFGLHLLVATQRPQKVHENVVTQCDNLVLMRMVARSDLAHAREAFSFVPPALLDLATDFGQGEAVVAGGLVREPALVRFGGRLSAEGGGDVPASRWSGRPQG